MTPDDLFRLAVALCGGVAVFVAFICWRIWQIRAAKSRPVVAKALGPLLDDIDTDDRRRGSVVLLCELLPALRAEEVQRLRPPQRSAYYNLLNPSAVRNWHDAELAAAAAEAMARMSDVDALHLFSNLTNCLDAPPFTASQATRIRQAMSDLTACQINQLKHGHLLRPSEGEPEMLLRPVQPKVSGSADLLLPVEPTSHGSP